MPVWFRGHKDFLDEEFEFQYPRKPPKFADESSTDEDSAPLGVPRLASAARRNTVNELGRKHDEHIAPKGYISETHFAMVHTPVNLQKAMRIPKAKAAFTK